MSVPRRWLELRVRSPSAPEEEPLLAEALLALGGRAVEERDDWYLTHVPEPPDEERFLEDARARLTALTGIESIELEVRWQDHEDWAELWRRGLGPRRVGERLIVTPSWESPEPGPLDHVIVIDPGMAFGTAEHGTTRGCLRLLERADLEGASVLDVGAGSGVLSIAAAKLGAREVVAVEGDSFAWEALEENVEHNGVRALVTSRREWSDPASLTGLGPRDGVVANIEWGVLGQLLQGLLAAVRPDGWLVLSGITVEEWPVVRAEVEAAGFRLVEEDVDEGWTSGRFVRDPTGVRV